MTEQEVVANFVKKLQALLPKQPKVQFTRWSVNREHRNALSIEPSRVDVVEHYQDAVTDVEKYKVQIAVWWGEDGHDGIPAASKIIMQGKQEFIVHGTVEEVTAALNGK
jgi:hypothetical protein